MNKIFLCLALTATIVSCTSEKKKDKTGSKIIWSEKEFNFNSKITHAKGFLINNHDGYKQLIVLDCWNNSDTLANYILYRKDFTIPKDLPDHDFLIPVPVDEIGTLSSTHVGFIDLIGEIEKITGISNPDKIYNPVLIEKNKLGKLSSLGVHMDHHFENIIELSPELLMKTGFENSREKDSRIIEAGIPIAYNTEWMETTLLGRAEWIKFVSAFFCKEKTADSIFNDIEERYLAVSQITKNLSSLPNIMYGNNNKGTWYMPGGKSYISELISNAGGDYYYINDSSRGSMALSFEAVLEHMIDAEIWLGANAKSLQELRMSDERYTIFKAFRKGNVFQYDKRTNKYGGNDYWESGVARPDLILKDIIKILHPELIPDYELTFYRKLPEKTFHN